MVNYVTTGNGFFGGTANRRVGAPVNVGEQRQAGLQIDREQFNELSLNIFNDVNQENVGVSPWEQVARFTAAVPVDVVDSVWASPLNPFGERGDVWGLMSESQRAYYERNKPMIEGTSAIVGGIGTAAMAEAIVIPRITASLMGSTAITSSRVWQAGRRWNSESLRGMVAAQRAAIREHEQFNLLTSAAGLNYLANRGAAGAAIMSRTLPIDYAIMWNNEAFNSGDLATESFWIAAAGGVGGAAGMIAARGVGRRVANSRASRHLIAEQMPLAGSTNALLATSYIERQPKARVDGKVIDVAMTKDSTEATDWLIASRADLPGGYDAPQKQQGIVDSLRAQATQAAFDAFDRITKKKITGVEVEMQPKMSNTPEIRHLVTEVAKEDPYLVYGLDEFGIPSIPFREALKTRSKHIEDLYTQSQIAKSFQTPQEAKDMAKLAAKMKKQEPFAYANGQWFDPESEIIEAVRTHSDKMARNRIKYEGDSAAIPSAHSQGSTIMLDASFIPRKGRNSVNVASMSMKDRLNLTVAAKDLMTKMLRPNSKMRIRIGGPGANNWFQLDMADEILARAGDDTPIVQFSQAGKLQTRADIRRESLRLKARALLKEVGPTGKITAEHRLAYNLPAPTTAELYDDPAGDAFRTWLTKAASEVGTADEMAQGLMSVRIAHGLDVLPQNTKDRLELTGKFLEFNRDSQGNFLRPMLGFFEPRQHMPEMLKNGYAERLMMEKAEALGVLTNPTRNNYFAPLFQRLQQSPVFEYAHRVNELWDAQVTGMGGKIRQTLGEFLPKRFLSRDNRTIQAAHRIHEMVEREARVNFKALLDNSGLGDVTTLLSSRANVGLRAELDQYASLRPGWDVRGRVEMGGGRYGFELDDTSTNRYLLGVDKVEEGTLLSNPRTGQAITVSEQGAKILDAFKNMTDALYEGTNTVRAANALPRIAKKNDYMPAPSTKGKRVGFLQDPAGNIVPMATIVEPTQEAYDRAVKRTLEEFGAGYQVKTKEAIESVHDVFDLEKMNWVDHGSSTAVRRGPQEGGLTPAFTKDGAFLDAIDWAKSQMTTQYNDALRTVMRHPIQVARMRSAAERAIAGQRMPGEANKGVRSPTRNIFDEYENALTGNSKSYAESATLSKFVSGAEDFVDGTFMIPARHLEDVWRRLGAKAGILRGKRTYGQILEALGPYSPYRSAEEYVASQGVRNPLTTRKISQGINKLATNLVLRWDPFAAHAIMNLTGLIPTVLGGTIGGGAPSTMTVKVNGKNIPFIDSLAIIKGGIADMTSKTTHADWAEMVRNGDASQSAFEYYTTLGAIESKADWKKWADRMDEWVSKVSDESENISRQIAHFTGLRVADYQGIKGMQARHDFAREFANAAIADYAPSNRPELYQTAFGSVFGLFQSYAMNQFTKMFHWMEKGDYKALGMQAATQASMFGVAGAYGASGLFALHDKIFKDSGEPSLMDTLYNQFGPTLGNAIAHGGIAEITNVALWTRGDMEPRMPVISGMAPPGIDVLKRMASITAGSAQRLVAGAWQKNPETVPAIIEHIQQQMPNRVLKGVMGVMQGGYETDRSGNIQLEHDSWMESIVRVAGYRTTRQQLEQEAFYAGRADMQRDAVRMERIRKQFRTEVRRSEQSGKSVDPVKYFDKYVEAGGNPKSFRSWAKSIMRESTDPRSAATLRKNLQTPRNQLELWRYGAYGAWSME